MVKLKFILPLLAIGLFLLNDVFSQSIIIKGEVVDAKSAEPLSFATIGIKGTSIGTATNSEGKFIVTVPDDVENASLFCSFMGYENYEIPIKDINGELKIELKLDVFTLDEVEVRPWEPWDYIWNAMQKIPDNYPLNPYMTEGYYSEFISENDVFLKFTEGVVETFNPSYGDKMKSQSKVLKARRGEDLGTLQFMREKLDKKFEKEKKKAAKKGEEWDEGDTIDEEIISASFGGPEEVLSADPLRDTASFLDIKFHKKYRYHIEGYSRYYGEQVIIIGFESKGVYEHQRQSGNIYISMETDAIMSIEYDSEIVVPALARPVIFLIGLGVTNPELHGTVHYKPINGVWYLNDISLEGGTKLTKRKVFKKNERSNFYVEISLINNKFELDKVHQIPEEEQIDNDKALEEQVEPDEQFWKTYQVVRPSRLK